jgi:glycosyltransferase involved in cell wall biosynthesis
LLLFLNRTLILRHLDAVLSTSQVISDQFAQAVCRPEGTPVFAHLPTYDDAQFVGIIPVRDPGGTPFETIFTGRMEADKGVFDVLQIAERLRDEHPGEFRFHLCGDGSELDRVRELVRQRALQDSVQVHGYCEPTKLAAVMSQCQAAIVPTRTECPAGFEMTCAEAILCGRPLITSAVCPALHYLRPASIEVPPNDVEAYKRAITQLRGDPGLYATKRDATRVVREQFLDRANSWDFAMRRALGRIIPDRLPGSGTGELLPAK